MFFLFLSILILNLLAIMIPKKLTMFENYTTILFSLVLSGTADLFLDAKYELYHYFSNEVEYRDYIAMVGLYPAVNILFLNLYPYQKSIKMKAVYIIGWSIFAIIYEWVATTTELFSHNDWKLWYSAMIYPFLYLILLGNLKWMRRLKRQPH